MIGIKLATMEDFDFFYKMKCEESNMWWTGSGEVPPRENIYKFFTKSIAEQKKESTRKLFIIHDQKERIGYLYLIPDGEEFDLPVAIAEDYRGRHYSEQAIICGLNFARDAGYKIMRGHIRKDNLASLNAYKKCGAIITDNYIFKEVSYKENDRVLFKKVKMQEVIIEL